LTADSTGVSGGGNTGGGGGGDGVLALTKTVAQAVQAS
jgi:hypothetical protein